MMMRSSYLLLVVLCVAGCFSYGAQAQTSAQPTLDPSEAAILSSVFQQWGLTLESKQWNTITGDPCSRAAVDATSVDVFNFNLLIKCNCSFNNGTTCRITQMKVYALDAIGIIPEELYSLTYLFSLNLAQNYLTGPLSPSIGNLTRMQYLSLGINALSGELPKELGNLTELVSLAFGSNNFSGPLPPEIGNLAKLQQIYFDSSGVSGEIPSSFAKLHNLRVMWGSDNKLTGRIPNFIQNWTNLTSLRFEGNSFEGPIPSSISSLTSLTDLRISDLANGSSSLTFIKNLNSLNILILRNDNISGSIPAGIWGNRSLSLLDLSFNNLDGPIPESLFSISTLDYLFLGNNKLTGSLPAIKSASLRNIDLSYNSLSGSFPSWINNQSLQLNLVANNFISQASYGSNSLSGLNCLQQNFPCYQGRYYDFAIKSGGPQFRSNDGTVYESENETLGAASHYMADSRRWAVSNVGLFSGSNNPQYTINSSSQFSNTLDMELFQTARFSSSSLRYYGLGLKNGNYTVTLQFAETVIESSSTTWKSRGRRIFDIYIQGNQVAKDFDIQREAGGVSFRAVRMEYKGQVVTENYLEIHFFWAGKGTCCIPAQGTYGPLVSAVRATPEFNPTVRSKNYTGLIAGILVGVLVVGLPFIFMVYFVVRRRRLRARYDAELIGIDARPYTFSYAELKAATEDFKPDNKLGEGGFGPVYKGTLPDGRVIAVKQLSVASHQGKSQFVAEIATISAVQHRNLVKLYGCCIEGDKRLLVYEYLVNKSLDKALFGKRSLSLDWSTRLDICVGVARGLAYLHEESRLRIVHRDVKASNILLDADLIPKISDFGLAKLYDDKKTHISTRVAGTIGYLAPEYAMRGHLTEKTDVFAFGVVALELVSGRLNSDSNLEDDNIYLLESAWNLHENNSEVDLVDQKLSTFNEEEVRRVIGVGLLCTQTSPMLRPPMSRVVAMLTGDIEVGRVTSKPGYLTDWEFDDLTTFMTDDATRGTDTTYSSTTTVATGGQSPISDSKPMLQEMVKEGW